MTYIYAPLIDWRAQKQERIFMRFLMACFLIILWAGGAYGQSLEYNFQTLDISIPGHPGLVVFPTDINDRGRIVTNIRTEDELTQALIVKPNRRGTKFKNVVLFSCTGVPFADTSANAINKRGHIVGGCVDAPSAPSKEFGFVRYKDGRVVLLDFPGADGTQAFGISDKGGLNNQGLVVGQFFGPLRDDHGGALSYRFHCFIWDGLTYKQIDFFRENTFVSCEGINSAGQVLMRYITVDLGNNTLEAGAVIYDNGTYQLLGLDFLHEGGPGQSFTDINELGQMPVQRSNTGDPDFDGLWFWDDGKFYRIALPEGWRLVDVNGINNLGQFTGVYGIQTGVDPFHGNAPLFSLHGFIATPAKAVRFTKGTPTK